MREYINDTNFNCTVEEVANKVFEIKAPRAFKRLYEQTVGASTAGVELCDWIEKNISSRSDIDEATECFLLKNVKCINNKCYKESSFMQ